MFGVETAFGFILRTSPAAVELKRFCRTSPTARKSVDPVVKRNQLRNPTKGGNEDSVTRIPE